MWAERGVRDRGLVLLRQVELALLFKTRARVALAEGLVLGPFVHSAESKASLADVGLMVPSHERGFQ